MNDSPHPLIVIVGVIVFFALWGYVSCLAPCSCVSCMPLKDVPARCVQGVGR